MLNNLTITHDDDAFSTSMEIALKSEAQYIKRPVYEKKLLSKIFGKNYIKSDALHDSTPSSTRNRRTSENQSQKTLKDFPEEIILGLDTQPKPLREKVEEKPTGYCIRTGAKIPFNPKQPLSLSAYREWSKYNNMDFPEGFCHKTGRPSNGKTSMRKPILYD